MGVSWGVGSKDRGWVRSWVEGVRDRSGMSRVEVVVPRERQVQRCEGHRHWVEVEIRRNLSRQSLLVSRL